MVAEAGLELVNFLFLAFIASIMCYFAPFRPPIKQIFSFQGKLKGKHKGNISFSSPMYIKVIKIRIIGFSLAFWKVLWYAIRGATMNGRRLALSQRAASYAL